MKRMLRTLSLITPLLFTLASAPDALAYYDPGVQRWINGDPVGDIQSAAFSIPRHTPVRWNLLAETLDGPNLYRFARNHLGLTDPWGLACGSSASEWVVPDTPIFDFTQPCENHDACYGTCGSSKGQCDGQFLQDMKEQCQAQANSPYFCYLFAYTYYTAVVGLGDSAFRDAQFWSCPCTALPSNGPPALVPGGTTVIYF